MAIVGLTRNKRSTGTFKNELEGIKGIGKSTATQLLKQFKSVKKIRELSEEELTASVGLSKAKIIRTYFNSIVNQSKNEGEPGLLNEA